VCVFDELEHASEGASPHHRLRFEIPARERERENVKILNSIFEQERGKSESLLSSWLVVVVPLGCLQLFEVDTRSSLDKQYKVGI
jgi:hypothetical protein